MSILWCCKKKIRNDRFWYFWWRFPQEVNNLTIRVEYRNEIRTRKIRPQMCFLRVFFQCYHLFVCFQSCGNDKWVILFHLVCFGRTSKNTVKHGVTYRNVFFNLASYSWQHNILDSKSDEPNIKPFMHILLNLTIHKQSTI